VYNVKHDERHKACLVAGGHLSNLTTESVYSGVVSLRGIGLGVFLAELYGLELWASDVGNTYLEAKTKEKVYIGGSPEFGSIDGHTLLVDKALYGLRSLGLRWHERLADVSLAIRFTQCKAEADIWMHKNVGLYEYIAVYVDGLLIAARNPNEIVKVLKENNKIKLKGVGPLTYHLGCYYFQDINGTLGYGPGNISQRRLDNLRTCLDANKGSTNHH
jgi:Reverse transcriptase (RNA-dependent DNA polymerase)